MSVYEEAADSVLAALEEYGLKLPIERDAKGDFDPVAGKHASSTVLRGEVTCIIKPASQGTIEAFDNRVDSNDLVAENYRFLMIAAKGLKFAPMNGDRIMFEGHQWRVLGSTPVAPAGTPILYRVGVMQ